MFDTHAVNFLDSLMGVYYMLPHSGGVSLGGFIGSLRLEASCPPDGNSGFGNISGIP